MKEYDVVVVGAGPAGATAARICAKNKLKTLLLEKNKIPREKPCAGGISPRALKEIDFELPEGIIERRCLGMRVVQGRLKNEVMAGSTVAFMVTRAKFDACLTEKAREAGTEIRDGETCKSIEILPKSLSILEDLVLVQTDKDKYQASIIIGADGVHSKVAEAVRPKFTQKQRRYCIIAEIPMPEREIEEMTHNLIELHYGYVDMGYAWVFPKKDYISVGIGGTFTQAKMLKERFKEFLKLHHLSAPVTMKGGLIPISNFRYNCYTDRIMLTGDAAGWVDCFSGEGILLAMASGRMAAETAVRAHRENDFSKNILKTYQEKFYREFKEDLIWSTRMTGLFFRFPNLVLGTLLLNSEVIRRYFRVIAGELSFKNFSKWTIARLPGLIFRRFIRCLLNI